LRVFSRFLLKLVKARLPRCHKRGSFDASFASTPWLPFSIKKISFIWNFFKMHTPTNIHKPPVCVYFSQLTWFKQKLPFKYTFILNTLRWNCLSPAWIWRTQLNGTIMYKTVLLYRTVFVQYPFTQYPFAVSFHPHRDIIPFCQLSFTVWFSGIYFNKLN